MKRALIVLAVIALVASAGDMISGGSDLTKFTGHASFRWTMNGYEDINPSSTMSTYSYISWLPKLNEYVDGKIGATITTPGDEDFEVCYAYLNLHFADNFTLAAGQMNIPFGYAYTRSSGSMYFADRSAILSGNFSKYGGKDNTAMITAEFAPVTVDLALSNGTGMRNTADNDINKQFAARLAVDPTEWLTIGGSVTMIGNPDYTTPDSIEVDAFSSNGMDFFAVANYPVSPTGTFRFVGEYMILGYPQEAAEGWEDSDETGMSIMAGYDMELDGDVFVRVMPAVRYDSVNPWDAILEGGDELEDGETFIDFSVNVGLFSNLNTLQIGARNYGFENSDIDGYTDIYAKWRMNF